MPEATGGAGRSHPTLEARGGARVQGRKLGGGTSHLRPGAVTLRSHPEPKARGGSWEEPLMPEARAGGREEHPEEQ